MIGFHQDVLHVGRAGAEVLGGDVLSSQSLNQGPMGAKESLPVLLGAPAVSGASKNHRLAAAQGQPRQRVLIGHAAGQAQSVGSSFLIACVMPITSAADFGNERSEMNHHDALVASCRVAPPDHALVSRHRLLADLHLHSSNWMFALTSEN